jgi:AraC-like DNA-binding protein
MKITVVYNSVQMHQEIVGRCLKKAGVKFSRISYGEVIFTNEISEGKFDELNRCLAKYGIIFFKSQTEERISKIKKVIDETVTRKRTQPITFSKFLEQKLGVSYGYLSEEFKENQMLSIESYLIFKKIEYAKELLKDGLSMTEVSYRLNYSSPAHLSLQFKKLTGMTPSLFKRVMEKKNR